MAETKGITGKGTTLSHSATIGGSYTPFAEVSDSNIPELTMPAVDATNYLSPNSATEKIPTGWFELGEESFTCTYESVNTSLLYSLVGVKGFFKITLPIVSPAVAASTYVWEGWISALGNPIPNKDLVKQLVKITATGTITFVAGV